MRKKDVNLQLVLSEDTDNSNHYDEDQSNDEAYFEENEDYFYEHDFNINKDKKSEQ